MGYRGLRQNRATGYMRYNNLHRVNEGSRGVTRGYKGLRSVRRGNIFPKGLVHGFDQNWQFFHLSILGKQRQQNVFHYILKRENPLLDHKNNKLKHSKNSDFSKRVSPWFWSKFGNFSIFLS